MLKAQSSAFEDLDLNLFPRFPKYSKCFNLSVLTLGKIENCKSSFGKNLHLGNIYIWETFTFGKHLHLGNVSNILQEIYLFNRSHILLIKSRV